ncbi:hypothetical protein B0H14DRAFT_2650054 [Mycena olivaceomarginata]|nr:hypothetical protein B0H14DRAFT_2650054 [Mycena olivaceomarginata]
MPDTSRISSSRAPHYVSFNFADQLFNVHSKGKVCGASPLCYFLPSSLLLYLTDVITLCSESLHLSIPDAALIFPPDGKQNRDAQLETAQHGKEVSSPFALHLTSVLLVCNQNQKRHVGIIFTRVCSSLRLKAALRPQKADLERRRQPGVELIFVLFGVPPTVSDIANVAQGPLVFTPSSPLFFGLNPP